MRNPLAWRRKALTATPTAVALFRAYGGGFFAFPRSAYVDGAFFETQNASYAALYSGQPNVRTVVDYIARTTADLGLKLYSREPNNDRDEDRNHPAAESVRRPNPWQGPKELLAGFVGDRLVYDNAYLVKVRTPPEERTTLVRIPPYAMGLRGERLSPEAYRLTFRDGRWRDLSPEHVIHWRGYNALDPRMGVSLMETLRQELIEEATRQAQAIEFWRGGAVKGGIIQRPLEAPDWSEDARARFEEGWANRMKGLHGGKSPVLEEGMEFVDAGVTPKEAEAIAARELSLATVCRAFGINPRIFGLGDGDLEQARDQFEEDLLMPLAGQITEVLNVQLLGADYDDYDSHYFEFTPRADSDQAKFLAALVSAVGGPVLTANEGRRKLNQPPVPGGDDLIVPLNVTRGGKPSPAVMPIQDPSGPNQDGSERTPPNKANGDLRGKATRLEAQRARRDEYAAEHAETLRAYFRRQKRSLKSAKGAGKADIDMTRWDKELASDLELLAKRTVAREGEIAAARLMGDFDPGQTENYVSAGAAAAAKGINAATAERLSNGDEIDDVFDHAVGDRADEIAVTRATQLAAFAHMEAGKQNEPPGTQRLKQWIWSGLQNSRHGHLAGEAVPLYDTFSNGAQYPGDPALPTSETARCGCQLAVL